MFLISAIYQQNVTREQCIDVNLVDFIIQKSNVIRDTVIHIEKS